MPRVPKIVVLRNPIGVKAVMVSEAVTPPAYSMFTTWWSTTSLSQS